MEPKPNKAWFPLHLCWQYKNCNSQDWVEQFVVVALVFAIAGKYQSVYHAQFKSSQYFAVGWFARVGSIAFIAVILFFQFVALFTVESDVSVSDNFHQVQVFWVHATQSVLHWYTHAYSAFSHDTVDTLSHTAKILFALQLDVPQVQVHGQVHDTVGLDVSEHKFVVGADATVLVWADPHVGPAGGVVSGVVSVLPPSFTLLKYSFSQYTITHTKSGDTHKVVCILHDSVFQFVLVIVIHVVVFVVHQVSVVVWFFFVW